MDIAATLAEGRIKQNIDRVREYVGSNNARLELLMQLVLHGTDREQQLSSWVLSEVCDHRPELAKSWSGQMLLLLEQPLHPGTHRNIIRSFQFMELPEPHHGMITDKMMAILADPHQPIASRAYAITVAMRMVHLYPELATEMKLLIEEVLRVDSGPAVRSRAIKARKRLTKFHS